MANPKFFTIILVICNISEMMSFNISPAPNIIIQKPKLTTFLNETRSSYFGFQVNLRRNHVLISAPRAQSTLEQQRKVQETGAIYKCSFDDTQPCHPYHFDLNGNTRTENDLAYNSEKKDFQMLGFAMDGHETEEDKFVACAPHLKADLEESNHYLLHGICYWVNTTDTIQPSGVRQINPLRVKTLQTMPADNETFFYFYIYGQMGFSVHMTDDSEEIIIGAVGILNWKGSVVRYRGGKRPDLGGLSRRDLSPNPYRILRKRQVFEYRSEIPSPFYSSLSDDSYFGYAVSSAKFLGPENDTLFYVASAPQSNGQRGEVFIFDIEDYRFEKKIKVFNKFSGSQFGEYYGYSLLSEDLNKDGFPDLIVTAPLYSKNGLYESGAVYVYINKGNLAFDQQALIVSDYDGNGRFGTSISRLGDINLDGYNDIAIAAPFEENGAVYIYLGTPQGLSSRPSQKIQAPSELPNPFGDITSMFGYGLSKGVDIDSNGYRDIAIGSPSSEAVYVFKSYPVVKVMASIISSKNEILLEEKSITIKVCATLQTMTEMNQEVKFATSIMLDTQYNRASFSPREIEKVLNETTKLNQEERCNDYTIHLRGNLADIFKPLTIEYRYEPIEGVPEYSHEFCETCVAMDPNEMKSAILKIAFSTGCSEQRCVSDLAVVGTLVNVRQPYVLGSTRTIEIKYEISNSGESSYLTQLSVTIPTAITEFSRIPSTCRQDVNNRETMICDINNGKPLKNQEMTELTINLDASRLEGDSLKIIANVSSAADESRPSDNVYVNEIVLTEFSDLELNGLSSATQLSLEDGFRMENLQYKYKIFNNGPSTIKELTVSLFVPIIYLPFPNYYIPIVNISDLSIMGFYINKVLGYKMKETVNLISFSNDGTVFIPANLNHEFDASKMGFDYELNVDRSENFDTIGQSNNRKRRMSLHDESANNRMYNRFTRQVMEEQLASFRAPIEKEDATLLNLPRNRTIFLDCIEEYSGCLEIEFTVHNFRPGSEPLAIHLNFSMDLSKMDEIFNEKQNILLYKTLAKFYRKGDENQQTLKITTRNPYTIVYEKLTSKSPIWIWVVSVIVGILVLILLSYALYKLGFFKRAQKEELEKMVRESRNITSEQAEELRNLNS